MPAIRSPAVPDSTSSDSSLGGSEWNWKQAGGNLQFARRRTAAAVRTRSPVRPISNLFVNVARGPEAQRQASHNAQCRRRGATEPLEPRRNSSPVPETQKTSSELASRDKQQPQAKATSNHRVDQHSLAPEGATARTRRRLGLVKLVPSRTATRLQPEIGAEKRHFCQNTAVDPRGGSKRRRRDDTAGSAAPHLTKNHERCAMLSMKEGSSQSTAHSELAEQPGHKPNAA